MSPVIPAKAGTHDFRCSSHWIPAFAGMTSTKDSQATSKHRPWINS